MEQAETFAVRLRRLREEAGMTQAQLAEAAGMSMLGVAKIEQGLREPAWTTVQALCAALKVRCAAFEGTIPSPEVKTPRKRGRPKKKRGGGEE